MIITKLDEEDVGDNEIMVNNVMIQSNFLYDALLKKQSWPKCWRQVMTMMMILLQKLKELPAHDLVRQENATHFWVFVLTFVNDRL